MQNVEFKAELRDPDLARSIIGLLGASRIGVLEQTDTYFNVPRGKLKKREQVGEATEYIVYERMDLARPRISQFSILDEETALERYGQAALPIRVVVKKTRELWMLAASRIHLDDVENLGRFLEVEVLVSIEHNVARAHEAIASLRESLMPALGEPIATGYAELMETHLAEQTGKGGR